MAAVLFALGAGFSAGLRTWVGFRLTHAELAHDGWLPWPLWAFLDDAYERRVLRRAGTVYQFRHYLLQDHLTRVQNAREAERKAQAAKPDSRAGKWLLESYKFVLAPADQKVWLAEKIAPGSMGVPAARRWIENGDLAKAERTLQAVIRLRNDSDAWDAVKLLAQVLASQGRLADLYEHVGRGDRALWLAASLARYGHPQVAIQLLHNLADDGNDQALEKLRQLQADFPG
ncbi:hypothetical protein ACQEVF_56720 [Nonomuraea polychroma]|uniref:hypothetical protein n=1 Tax=Nonomuraea polychroma TaxID=46176 RepID=UPI003D8BC2EA